jgi:hypothetical protein
MNGDGPVTSVNHNTGAPTIAGDFIETFNLAWEREVTRRAIGHDMPRGEWTLGRVTYTADDVSALSQLLTLMTARTKHTFIATYADGDTLTLTNGRLRVLPRANLVRDIDEVLVALATGGSAGLLTGLDAQTNWVSFGSPEGASQPAFGFASESEDSMGRPRVSGLNVVHELQLPDGDYDDAAPFIAPGVAVHVALALPNGNYQVYQNCRLQRDYTDQDASRDRGVKLTVRGAKATLASLFTHHDGSAGAYTMPDFLYGYEVVYVGSGYQPSDFAAWAP